jgi:hypothetical protein
MTEHAEDGQPRSAELYRRALAHNAARGQGPRIADTDWVEYLDFGKAQAMRRDG